MRHGFNERILLGRYTETLQVACCNRRGGENDCRSRLGQRSAAIPPQRRSPQINKMKITSFGKGQRPRPRASVSSSRAKSGDPIQLPDLELNK